MNKLLLAKDTENFRTSKPTGLGRNVLRNSRTDLVFLSGEVEIFRHVDPDDFMWNGHGDREVRQRISFRGKLPGLPMIFLSLISVDSSQGHNLRYELTQTNVERGGFTVVFRTWSDTKIASARLSWMAISQPANTSLDGMMDRKQ